nr:hypothetical protein [Williamsia soli]
MLRDAIHRLSGAGGVELPVLRLASVKSHDLDVFADSQPVVGNSTGRRSGLAVRCDHYALWWGRPGVEELSYRPVGAVRGEIAMDMGDVGAVDSGRAAVALLHGLPVSVVHVGLGEPADERNVATLRRLEGAPGGDLTGPLMVDPDDGRINVSAHVVHPHERHPRLRAQRSGLGSIGRTHHDETIDADLGERAHSSSRSGS